MSIFGASSIIIFFASLGFGLYVYSRDRIALLNRYWFSFSVSVSVWGLALYGVTSTKDLHTAMYWQYALDVAGICIPILYFFFVSNLLDLKNSTARAVVSWVGLLLIAFSFTDWFKTGIQNNLGFFWIEPGRFYFLFPIFFAILVLYSVYLLIKYQQATHDAQLRQQIKYQLLGALIGFGGGLTNFLPQLFDIFPFGNYFVTLYVIFVGYSVIQNRLFNIKTAAIELFASGTSLVFLFNLLATETLQEWFKNIILLAVTLFLNIIVIRNIHKVEKLLEEKSEFMSFASHQVKGPLTSFKNASSMLLQGDFGPISEQVREIVKGLYRTADQAVPMVQAFLDSSKLEQEGGMKYQMEPCDLKKIAEEVVREERFAAEEKGLTLSLSADEATQFSINGDALKLKQVILNLVDNAIKFTSNGNVSVSLAKRDGKIICAVKDSGVGIPKEEMPKLFKKFSRANGSAKVNVASNGLGLYLAAEFVKAHNGRIWAESAGAGNGSTFFVEVPAV
jgi:signal transduction histidine kinase